MSPKEYYNYLRSQLKQRLNYNLTKIQNCLDHTYLGTPLIYYNRENNIGPIKCYDVNSSYETSLLNDIFPLDSEFEIIEGKDISVSDLLENCWILMVKVKNIKRKNIQTDLVKLWFGNNLKWQKEKECYQGFVTNIALENIKLLYDCDVEICQGLKFKHCGKLDIEDLIEEAYLHLHTIDRTNPEYKILKGYIHKAFYGIMCYGKMFGKTKKQIEFPKRTSECIIPIFQIDYRRLYMTKLMLKYFDDVVYIDTDSLFVKQGCDFQETVGNNIGEFKIEESECLCDFFRFKGYIIYRKDGTRKQVFSQYGKEPLTDEQIKELKTNGILKTKNGTILNEFEFGNPWKLLK